MKNQFVRVTGLMLVLALASGVALAQKVKPGGDPAGQASSCTAGGAWCLFGSAGGCTASCLAPQKPHCTGASCIGGFPSPASCTCV